MMMLRLARAGSKKRPVYHLVAADKRARRDGRYVENLGYYVPAQDVLVLNQERVEFWKGHGAQPSPTADRLIRRAKKLGNTAPKEKAKYEPPPIKPVEPKVAEAPKADAPKDAEAPPAEASASTPADDAAAKAE